MKIARNVLNSLMGVAVEDLDEPLDRYGVADRLAFLTQFVSPKLSAWFKGPGRNEALRILSDALRRTPYNEPLQMAAPLAVTVSVTDKCGMSCKICYAESTPSAPTAEIELDLVYLLARSLAPTIILTGGEPLCARRICEIVRILTDAKKNVYIATNSKIEKVMQLAGIFGPKITFLLSVYGNSTQSNSVRGENTFEEVLEIAERAPKETGSRVKVNCVLLDDDLTVFGLIEHRLARTALDTIVISRAISVGRNNFHADGCHHQPGSSQELIRCVRDLRQKTGKRVLLSMPGVEEISEIPAISKLAAKMFGVQGITGGCSAGNWGMHVTSDGYALPCFAYPKNNPWPHLGDVSVAEAWKTVRALKIREAGLGCAVENKMTI